MRKAINDLQKREKNILISLLKAQNRVENTLVLLEKVDVLTNDIAQGYFDQKIEEVRDAWKLMPPYYDNARIKTDIVYDFILELKDSLEQLNQELCELSEEQKTA